MEHLTLLVVYFICTCLGVSLSGVLQVECKRNADSQVIRGRKEGLFTGEHFFTLRLFTLIVLYRETENNQRLQRADAPSFSDMISFVPKYKCSLLLLSFFCSLFLLLFFCSLLLHFASTLFQNTLFYTLLKHTHTHKSPNV
jgi:hypothetical protein